jgi:hypothetical protein
MNIIKVSTLGLLVLLGASTVAVAQTAGIADAASVKMLIESDGYTGVQNVVKSTTGWTADAMESGKSVKLTVDVQGGIAKN